jgi:hypothetical protein
VDVHRGEAAAGLGVRVGHRDRHRFLQRQHVVDAGLAREPSMSGSSVVPGCRT